MCCAVLVQYMQTTYTLIYIACGFTDVFPTINVLCRREDLKRWVPRGPIRAYRGRKDEKLLSLCSCVFSVCLCTQLWAFILAAYL